MNRTDHEASTEIEEAERLLREVCPDLQGTNLYLVDVSQLVGHRETPTVAYAATGLGLDETLRPFVDWKGKGIGILISLATVETDNVDLLALLTHEIAHCLADGFLTANRAATPATSAETIGQLAACRRLFERTERDATDETYQTEASDTHHNQRWARAALHLRHRLDQAGYTLGVHELLAPTAAIHSMHAALSRTGEYERFEALSFEEILNQPLLIVG